MQDLKKPNTVSFVRFLQGEEQGRHYPGGIPAAGRVWKYYRTRLSGQDGAMNRGWSLKNTFWWTSARSFKHDPSQAEPSDDEALPLKELGAPARARSTPPHYYSSLRRQARHPTMLDADAHKSKREKRMHSSPIFPSQLIDYRNLPTDEVLGQNLGSVGTGEAVLSRPSGEAGIIHQSSRHTSNPVQSAY